MAKVDIETRIIQEAGTTQHFIKIDDKWEFHRENDLPAIEYADGTKEWWVNGKLHREKDLPAIKYADGTRQWWVNGKLHREKDLPAIEYANGTISWCLNGNIHREGGLPAIEYADGSKEWYLNGVRITKEDAENTKIVRGITTTEYLRRKENGIWHLHRGNDLPAIEHADGTKEWWVNGKRHRENDLPAIECADGTKQWWVNGKLQYPNGSKEWWVNGKLSRKESSQETTKNEQGVKGETTKNEQCDRDQEKKGQTQLESQRHYLEFILEKYGWQESVFAEIAKILELERQ